MVDFNKYGCTKLNWRIRIVVYVDSEGATAYVGCFLEDGDVQGEAVVVRVLLQVIRCG